MLEHVGENTLLFSPFIQMRRLTVPWAKTVYLKVPNVM